MQSGIHGRRRAPLIGRIAAGAAIGFALLALAAPSLFTRAPGDHVLRVVGPWDVGALDPAATGYLYTRMQVSETLVDADDAGRPTPGLAESWDISADGREWRFHLRPKALFHDHTPVTAEQAAWVLNRAWRKPGTLSLAPIAEIVADAGDVVIRLKQPFSILPAVLAHYSTQILAASSFAADGTVQAVIGTGPYRVTSITTPQKFTTVLFDGWTGKRPAIAAASYLAVGFGETREIIAQTQQAELVYGLEPRGAERLRAKGPGRVLAVMPRTVVLMMDSGHPFLSDPRIRQAMSLAIARDDIAQGILRDSKLAAYQLFPPTLAGWHDDAIAPLQTDVARARALMAEAGWRPGADGIAVRGGQRFSLSLKTFDDRPELPVIAAAIQAQLKAIGIDISIEIVNPGEIPAARHEQSLELALNARSYSALADPVATLMQDFGPEGGDWGATHWSDARVTGSLDRLTLASDESPMPLRHAVAQTIQEALPVIPIAWYEQTVAVSPRVRGASLDPLERSYRLTDLTWADTPP